MCTLIVARNVFSKFSLVIAANRDELLDRPSETPSVRKDAPHILAPKDLQRGGTWIGVNRAGVCAALTNRKDIKSQKGRMSRGALVIRALQYNSAKEASEDIARIDGNVLNGFHLIIGDKNNLFLIKGDGKSLACSSEDDGLLVVTNHGVGRSITLTTPKRVARILHAWYHERIPQCEPIPLVLKTLLQLHDSERHGTCINEPQENYGTKSASVIRLATRTEGDVWEYWHRERSIPARHVCTEQFGGKMVFPII